MSKEINSYNLHTKNKQPQNNNKRSLVLQRKKYKLYKRKLQQRSINNS